MIKYFSKPEHSWLIRVVRIKVRVNGASPVFPGKNGRTRLNRAEIPRTNEVSISRPDGTHARDRRTYDASWLVMNFYATQQQQEKRNDDIITAPTTHVPSGDWGEAGGHVYLFLTQLSQFDIYIWPQNGLKVILSSCLKFERWAL